MTAETGPFDRNPLPAGFPVERFRPPVVAESGDPFASLLILATLAQVERGRAIRVDDIVDRLNANHLDWMFSRRVVVDAVVALQANWMADYRNASGIVLVDGERGPELTLEASSRVDPWIAAQGGRLAAECHAVLDAFARRDTPYGGG